MGTPKALLAYRGETFLDRLIRIFNETCSSVTVVLGHDPTIRHRIRRASEATFVNNPDHEKGQLTSLQCGLKAIPANAEAVIFTPVDYPAIEATTICALIDAALVSVRIDKNAQVGQDGIDAGLNVTPPNCNLPLVVVPRHEGRNGHPVLFASSLIAAFLALPPDAEARTIIRRNIADTAYVDVQDPGILKDIDDPQAYAELLEATK